MTWQTRRPSQRHRTRTVAARGTCGKRNSRPAERLSCRRRRACAEGSFPSSNARSPQTKPGRVARVGSFSLGCWSYRLRQVRLAAMNGSSRRCLRCHRSIRTLALFDLTPVTCYRHCWTSSASRGDTTVDAVRTDWTLWRRMHLADWNTVPETLRHEGLDNMLAKYQPILMSPSAWDAMRLDRLGSRAAADAHRRLSSNGCLLDRLLTTSGPSTTSHRGASPTTLAAIVMSESWFDHRGLFINGDGTQDIGLAGASDFARRRLRALHDTRSRRRCAE